MTTDAIDLSGQVSLVTGGGRGLGRAFAQALAAAGASVAITARTQSQLEETVKLIEESSGRVIAFNADVTDRAAMEKVVTAIEERLGPVDILVNNAGLITPLGNDWELDPDEWWQTIEINLHGPYICTRAVLPSMMSRRRGRIVNVSSVGAYTVHPYATAYCASKAALSHFTNCFAPAVKEYGISVFALDPVGPTAMHETLANSPQLTERRRERSRQIMGEEGHKGMRESVQRLMFMVSGKADALSGRQIGFRDSEADLLSRTEEILRDDLHVLRLRK